MATRYHRHLMARAGCKIDWDGNIQLRPRILAVGEAGNWPSAGQDAMRQYQIGFAEFRHVTAELLSTLKPDIVVAPLLCETFDCLDLAQTLHTHGFAGRFRVIAPAIPAPWIISTEIETMCPSMNFSLSFAGDDLTRRLH